MAHRTRDARIPHGAEHGEGCMSPAGEGSVSHYRRRGLPTALQEFLQINERGDLEHVAAARHPIAVGKASCSSSGKRGALKHESARLRVGEPCLPGPQGGPVRCDLLGLCIFRGCGRYTEGREMSA